jgi:hypothetical protein
MHDDDLQEGEQPEPLPIELEALQALRRAADPGRLLEERTVRALQREGLLAMAAQRSMVRPLAWAAAAAIAFFAVGFALGRGSGAAPPARDAAYQPADGPAAGTRDIRERRDRNHIQTAATDTTDATGARFVVWF